MPWYSIFMGSILTTKERIKLVQAHRAEKSQRFADRIKVILALDSGWSAAQIAEMLLIDEDTVRNYQKLYLSGGVEALCSFAYNGRECLLSDKEIKVLQTQLRSRIYLCTSEIIEFVKTQFEIIYSISGITKLLHRIGFSYKKPQLVPGKADVDKQLEFLKMLTELKQSKNREDKLYYGDGTHPQHNSLPSYGWLPKGEETKLKSNTGRQRVNINGVLDAESLEVIIDENQRLNAETTIKFFKRIEKLNPDSSVIYIILDNAGYYKGHKIKEYVKTSRIKIIFLPPYAPNLNLIERLWKFFKKQILYNRYYETFQEFRTACLNFFKKKNLNKHRSELESLLTENFQIVSA